LGKQYERGAQKSGGPLTTNVALYARYSSEHQNPRSLEDQLEHLRRHIAQCGGQPETARAFADAETSGAVWPGLQSLLRELEAALSDMRRDLEATAVLERSALADLKGRAEAPVPLSAVDANQIEDASFAATTAAK
jgi:Resolvase, N terminal domain